MPLYLDRHYFSELSEEQVEAAHGMDVAMQSKHDVSFLTYWFDQGRQTGFCLAMAPSADLISTIHSETHGQLPNDVAEVDQTEVLSFMGRIADIPKGERRSNLPVDRAMRTIMFTDLVGYTSFMSRLGDERAFELLREHNSVIRDALTKFGGREIKHTGDGVMAAFDEADQALRSAIEIRGAVANILFPDINESLSVRIGLTSGEPLQDGQDLFGSVVNLASRLCDMAETNEILISEECVNELTDDNLKLTSIGDISIRGFEKPIPVSKVNT